MSAASMRKVTSIPEGGTTFKLGPGVKINSITPLGTGNLVIKPISPLEGQTTETIEITEQLVGATFPGFGQTDLPAGTTALPLLVVFARDEAQMFPVYVPGASNASQVATSANQELALAAIDQIYDALLLVGTQTTSAAILAAVANLGSGSTLDDLATALVPLATSAKQEDILAALEAAGVDIDDIRSNIALLVPDLDAVRVAVQAMQSRLDDVYTRLLPSSTAGVPKTTKIVPTGTAEAIVNSSTPAKLVRVQVEWDETKTDHYVVIGNSSGITLSDGEQLFPGDTYSEAVDDAAKLFCLGSTSGLKLRIKVL